LDAMEPPVGAVRAARTGQAATPASGEASVPLRTLAMSPWH